MGRNNFLFLILVILLLVLFTSCQTLMRKPVQNIPATSKPPGVNVLVDGKLVGKTPVILKLERKYPHTVRFEAPGFRPVEIHLTQRRPPLGETILSASVLIPIGAVVVGLPLFYLWREAAGSHSEDFEDLGRLLISCLIGGVVGWGTGVMVDRTNPQSFDLVPQTLYVEMERAESPGAENEPAVIPVDAETFRQLRWIRVVSR